jgi:hypothetical protein
MPNNSRIAFTIAGALRELDPYEAPGGQSRFRIDRLERKLVSS